MRVKKLTRKQKEMLSADGWDHTKYLWAGNNLSGGIVLLNKDTNKFVVFKT